MSYNIPKLATVHSQLLHRPLVLSLKRRECFSHSLQLLHASVHLPSHMVQLFLIALQDGAASAGTKKNVLTRIWREVTAAQLQL
jgi:hypothetical protein